jgi:hypothetical protein
MGALAAEALVLSAFVGMLLPEGAAAAGWLVFGALSLALLQATVAGHSGAMHSAQLQLGVLYLGLFGSTALLLYAQVSALAPKTAYGTLAVAGVAVLAAIVLVYRRSKYVDTDPLRTADAGRALPAARLLSRFGKILNALLSLLLVLVLVIALMDLYVAGPAAVVRDGVAALRAETRLPGVALVALCLLPLFHPLVDVTHWQKLAAIRKDPDPRLERGRRSAMLRAFFRRYAAESCLMGLFMAMLGGMAAIDLTDLAAPLMLVLVFALALSTTSALISATLCTLRYDVLPSLRPELAPVRQSSHESTARRHTLIAGGTLAIVVASVVAGEWLRAGAASSGLLAVLITSGCAQLSLLPLVLGPIVGRGRRGNGSVSARWALAILGSGGVVTAAALGAYLIAANEAWLWAAVPACLATGALLFAIARVGFRGSE